MFSHSSICVFFTRVGAVLVKALFVGGNRYPLKLTQKKEIFILLTLEEMFMVFTRTLEQPGFMGGWLWAQDSPGKPPQWESVTSMRVFCH